MKKCVQMGTDFRRERRVGSSFFHTITGATSQRIVQGLTVTVSPGDFQEIGNLVQYIVALAKKTFGFNG